MIIENEGEQQKLSLDIINTEESKNTVNNK